LASFPPNSSERRRFLVVLLKLSRVSGLYPECLVRDDIQLIGTDPVAAGRFGDVWMGSMSNQQRIAVKIVRVYVRSDVEKLLKVLFRFIMYSNITHALWSYRHVPQKL
jgi:hypothetical protein